MRNFIAIVSVKYEKILLKTVGCEIILRKSLLNTQINKQLTDTEHIERDRLGSSRAESNNITKSNLSHQTQWRVAGFNK